MDANEIPVNVDIDLSKAFDSLDHNILLSKLKFYGVTGVSLDLMSSYLSNRRQQWCSGAGTHGNGVPT